MINFILVGKEGSSYRQKLKKSAFSRPLLDTTSSLSFSLKRSHNTQKKANLISCSDTFDTDLGFGYGSFRFDVKS